MIELLLGGLVLLMFFSIISLCRESGKISKEIEIVKEQIKQAEKSKEKENLTDKELLEWLEKQKK